MRKIFLLFLILIIVLLIAFFSAYIFINIKGKAIVTHKLEEILNRKVEISDIKASFPLSLKIGNLDIENLLKVDEIYVSFGVLGLLKRNIKLPGLRLLRPQLIVERTAESFLAYRPPAGRAGQTGIPFKNTSFGQNTNLLPAKNSTISSSSSSKEKPSRENPGIHALTILINRLIIKDGTIKFIDKTLEPEVFQLDIVNIDVKVDGISFPPKPFNLKFMLAADIVTSKDKSSHSTINGNGWINFIRKDMQGEIELNNLDGTYFFPYYQKFLSRKLKSANVNFNADLTAKNNDLTADCRLKIKDLLFEKIQTEQLQDIKIFDIIGGGLAQKARDVEVEFVIKTKLDKPKINSAQIRGLVLDKVLETVVTQPPQETIETIKDIGDKIKDIGKDLEEKFKGIFKKE